MAAVACGASHQSPDLQTSRQYSHSYVTTGCGPTDAPIVLLFFLDSREKAVRPLGKHIRIQLSSVEDLSHRMLRWPGNRPLASVARCTSVDSCESATEGQIVFGTAKPGKTYDGELDVTFANGERVRKAFQAPWWRPRPLYLCG